MVPWGRGQASCPRGKGGRRLTPTITQHSAEPPWCTDAPGPWDTAPCATPRKGSGQSQCAALSETTRAAPRFSGPHHSRRDRHALLVLLRRVQHAQQDGQVPAAVVDDGEGQLLGGLLTVVRVDVLGGEGGAGSSPSHVP